MSEVLEINCLFSASSSCQVASKVRLNFAHCRSNLFSSEVPEVFCQRNCFRASQAVYNNETLNIPSLITVNHHITRVQITDNDVFSLVLYRAHETIFPTLSADYPRHQQQILQRGRQKDFAQDDRRSVPVR